MNSGSGKRSVPVLIPVLFQQDSVNADAPVIRIPFYAFHTIIADFFRVQITAVTFSASDTFPVIQDALTVNCHDAETPPFFCIIQLTGKAGQDLNKVKLRRFTEEEYHLFFRGYTSDPMMDPSPFHYNHEQVQRSYIYNHCGYRDHYEHYGIFVDGRPVGSFQLKRIDPDRKTCEFGIIMQNDAVKNRGIGTEAIRAGIRIAHDEYHIETVIGDTMSRNKRMIHVFEKLGFIRTEIVPEAFELPDGTKEDRLVYSKKTSEE